MGDPLLLLVVATILTIAAVSAWVSLTPSDRAIARVHQGQMDKENLAHGGRPSLIAGETKEKGRMPRASFIALVLVLVMFFLPAPLLLGGPEYEGPTSQWEPWVLYMLGSLCFSVPSSFIALALAYCGVRRRRNLMTHFILLLTIVPLAAAAYVVVLSMIPNV